MFLLLLITFLPTILFILFAVFKIYQEEYNKMICVIIYFLSVWLIMIFNIFFSHIMLSWMVSKYKKISSGIFVGTASIIEVDSGIHFKTNEIYFLIPAQNRRGNSKQLHLSCPDKQILQLIIDASNKSQKIKVKYDKYLIGGYRIGGSNNIITAVDIIS